MNDLEALTNQAYNFSVIFQDFCSKYKIFYESVELNTKYFDQYFSHFSHPFLCALKQRIRLQTLYSVMTFIDAKIVCFDIYSSI